MAAGNTRQTDERPRHKQWRDLSLLFLSRGANGEKLSPEIRLEQMRMLVEAQKLPLPYAFPFLMVPYAACFINHVAWYWLAIPVMLLFFANWFNRRTLTAFTEAHPTAADVAGWERRFVMASGLFAIAMGSTAFFYWVPESFVLQSYVITALLVVLAPICLITSSYLPAFYATVLPIVAVACLQIAFFASTLHAALAARDPEGAARIRPTDRTRVLRALEVIEATGRPLAAWHAEPAAAPLVAPAAPPGPAGLAMPMTRRALCPSINSVTAGSIADQGMPGSRVIVMKPPVQ